MATVRDVLDNYFRLRGFCDALREAVSRRYGDQLACRPGCSGCCILAGVNMLEAAVLLLARRDRPHPPVRPAGPVGLEDDIPCPLLHKGLCGLYPARPLICRTHGLPLRGASLTGGRTDCCPLNFPAFDLETIEPDLILDADEVTMNLMRLNLAFCMLLQVPALAGERLSLAALLSGDVPAALRTLLDRHDL